MAWAAYNPKYGRIRGEGTLACDRGFIAHYHETPLASAVDKIHAAITLGAEAQTITTNITQPDVPRVLSITGVKAGSTLTGNVIINGTDALGEAISDTIALDGNNTVDGTKAFKTVTSIVVPAYVAEGDSVKIGTTDKLGIIHKLSHNTVICAFLNNVRESTAPTVTVNATYLYGNFVDLNSTLDGKVVDIYYIV